MPKISVIVPTYNRARFVTKAIDSVLAQTYKDYEIIVVDDGSTDNTKQVLRPYMDRIHYIYQENTGVSTARNAGIRAAKGDWVAFLDSDDEWLPERLAVAMEAVQQNPRIIAHFTNLAFHVPTTKEGNLFELRGISKRNEESWVIERPLTDQLKYGFCFSSNYFGRRKTLFDVSLFDEKLTIGEDFDLFCRLALAGPWGINKKVLVHIIRRAEPEQINLSRQRRDQPVYYYQCLVHIYAELASVKNLDLREKRLVDKRLSGARFDLGVAQLKSAARGSGLCNIRQSFLDNSSPKSLAKYLLVRTFGKLGVYLIEKSRSFSKKGFRRSDFGRNS